MKIGHNFFLSNNQTKCVNIISNIASCVIATGPDIFIFKYTSPPQIKWYVSPDIKWSVLTQGVENIFHQCQPFTTPN